MAFKLWEPSRGPPQAKGEIEVGSRHTDKISGKGKGTEGGMLITGCKAQT